MKTLSAYRVTWIEFRAVIGIVTKKDERILCRYKHNNYRNNDRIHEFFPNKDEAMKYIESKRDAFSKLGKSYEVRLFCDRQFAIARNEDGKIIIPFTKKQEKEMFIIGK